MNWSQGTAVVAVMLLLRLAVPVAITFAVGYALHRLDVRWHPETTSMV
jgi:type II secretory pathway component PulK